ncbi:MAG: DUF1786 family protein [bacterium]
MDNILAIDIGAGTQDILFYNNKTNIENCISMVLPSPTHILSQRVAAIKENLLLTGDTIGGGPLVKSLKKHLKQDYRVVMEESCAYTVRDNLDEVRALGIRIGNQGEAAYFKRIHCQEIDIVLFLNFLEKLGVYFPIDLVAIALQDHGSSQEGLPDRKFRFKMIEERLRNDAHIYSQAFRDNEVPLCYKRMQSAVNAAQRDIGKPVLIMDSAFSAIAGAAENREGPYMIVNIGNGHTVAAIVFNGRIDAFMEHHTKRLTTEKLIILLERFSRGQISNEEIYEDQGHGFVSFASYEPLELKDIIVTGPNRDKLKDTPLNVTFAAPGGNMMMTGPVGLIRSASRLYPINK